MKYCMKCMQYAYVAPHFSFCIQQHYDLSAAPLAGFSTISICNSRSPPPPDCSSSSFSVFFFVLPLANDKKDEIFFRTWFLFPHSFKHLPRRTTRNPMLPISPTARRMLHVTKEETSLHTPNSNKTPFQAIIINMRRDHVSKRCNIRCPWPSFVWPNGWWASCKWSEIINIPNAICSFTLDDVANVTTSTMHSLRRNTTVTSQ